MIPHPMAILVVSRAITAVIAVDERASIECLRHHGYASASQKESKPAASHARAMVRVSSIGSMLSCKTPIRKGTVIEILFLQKTRSEEHTSELQSRVDLVCR